jgi:transcriptional regulator with XRE-family HTH domain
MTGQPPHPMRFADTGKTGGATVAVKPPAGSSAPLDFAKLLPDDESRGVAAQAAAVAHVGKIINRARTRAGLSQDQLAARTGITQAHISELERGLGVNGPTILTLSRIMAALGDEAVIEAAAERNARQTVQMADAGVWLTTFTEQIATITLATPAALWGEQITVPFASMIQAGLNNPFIAVGLAGMDMLCRVMPGVSETPEAKAAAQTIGELRQELPLPPTPSAKVA